MFALNYWLGEFLLSAFANRFELSCEPKQLMLLYFKICPCSATSDFSIIMLCTCYFSFITLLMGHENEITKAKEAMAHAEYAC